MRLHTTRRFLLSALLALIVLAGCTFSPPGAAQPETTEAPAPTPPFPFLPEETTVCQTTADQVCVFLPANTEIQGLLLRGDAHRGWMTTFYPDGQLAEGWLAQPTDVQSVPCMAASFWTEVRGDGAVIQFHPNGRLARCKAAQDFTLQGRRFKRGDIVRLDSSGKIVASD